MEVAKAAVARAAEVGEPCPADTVAVREEAGTEVDVEVETEVEMAVVKVAEEMVVVAMGAVASAQTPVDMAVGLAEALVAGGGGGGGGRWWG